MTERRFDGYVRSALTPTPRTHAGVVDGMVVQHRDGIGSLSLNVDAHRVRAYDADGALVAEADGAGQPLRVEVPVGGPYRIEAERDDGPEVLARDVLVGDLWILGGQSNMYGFGVLEGSEESDPLVHMLDMARRWRVAEEPLHSMAHSPDRAHHLALGEQADAAKSWIPTRGAGPGLAFAKEMVRATAVPIGLIAVAQSGSSLAEWSPALAPAGGDSLYGSMLLSVRAAGGRARGVLWYQGESDTATDEQERTFRDAMSELINAMRRDIGAELAFYQVQLSRVTSAMTPDAANRWSRVRIHQTDARLGASGYVAAIDLELDDPIHLGTDGQRRLGRRLARLVAGSASPIRVASVEREGALGNWPEEWTMQTMRIRFSGLCGGLRPRRHVPGFSVRSPDGTLVPVLFRAAIDPDDPSSVILTLAGPQATPDDGIWYGYGADPFCDLVDLEDNAVPSFGPIALAP